MNVHASGMCVHCSLLDRFFCRRSAGWSPRRSSGTPTHLYGRPFQAFTDHKPLEQLTTSTRLNPRLARLAFKLQEWMVTIEYLPGEQNTLADALSREERDLPEEKSVPVQDGEEDVPTPGRHLAWGDVGETPPH